MTAAAIITTLHSSPGGNIPGSGASSGQHYSGYYPEFRWLETSPEADPALYAHIATAKPTLPIIVQFSTREGQLSYDEPVYQMASPEKLMLCINREFYQNVLSSNQERLAFIARHTCPYKAAYIPEYHESAIMLNNSIRHMAMLCIASAFLSPRAFAATSILLVSSLIISLAIELKHPDDISGVVRDRIFEADRNSVIIAGLGAAVSSLLKEHDYGGHDKGVIINGNYSDRISLPGLHERLLRMRDYNRELEHHSPAAMI